MKWILENSTATSSSCRGKARLIFLHSSVRLPSLTLSVSDGGMGGRVIGASGVIRESEVPRVKLREYW